MFKVLDRNCPLEVPIAIGIRGVAGLYLIFELVLALELALELVFVLEHRFMKLKSSLKF